MDELEKFCENCKRHVSATNFASHSAFCERNVKVCEICDEPYPINLEEDHLEKCHVVMPCSLCELPVEKWLLSKHQEVCVKRRIQCEFCELKLPFDQYSEHDDFCGSRTEKCLLCQKYVILKEKQKHTEFHRHERKMLNDHVKTQLDRNHGVEVSRQLGACQLEETEKSIVQDNPEEQNSVNEAISLSKSCGNRKLLKDFNHFTTCHVCQESIRWIDYSTHVRTCATDHGICSVCGERVSSGGMKDHLRRCSKNSQRGGPINAAGNDERRDVVAAEPNDSCKNEDSKYFTTCHVCQQSIRWIDYNTHVPACATDRGRCSMCGENVTSGGMKAHLMRCPKNYQRAEPVDRMESNTRNSPHLSSPRHPAYSDSYECPLCLENIPERDKGMHESFHCKVLLNLDKSDYFLPKTNFDFSKASQERSKKVASELSATGSERKHGYKSPEPTKSSGKFKTAEHSSYLEGSASNTFRGRNESKGAMPKYPSLSKMVIPTVGRCKHCKTFLNDDILAIHEEQCIHREIKCSYCDDAFKVMDADHHACKWKKVKGKHDKKNAKPKDSDSSGFGWGNWGIFSRKSNFSQDKCESGRNKSYSAITANKFLPTQDDTSTFQHFSQMNMDDTQIPCEFCGKLVLVHRLIEHETGCSPDEVSYAKQKPENVENDKERKPDAPQRSDQAGKSYVAGGNSFFNSGKPPSSKNKSHKKHQDSGVKPGEFLNINSLELSPQLEDKKNESQLMGKKSNSSAIFSVWNGGSSDDMFEETPTNVSPRELLPKKKPHTTEDGKPVSDGSDEFYSGSDEEVSEMLRFINDRKRELCENTVERETHSKDSETFTQLHQYMIRKKPVIEESPLPTGAAAGGQPEETPFKEAFDYILNAREEFLTEDKACWNPSKIGHAEQTIFEERGNVEVNLNEHQKIEESFSSAKEGDKEMESKWRNSPGSR